MDDAKIATIARRYVWALEAPEPPDVDLDTYYEAGPTTDEILDELKQAVHAELSESFKAVRDIDFGPLPEVFNDPTTKDRLRKEELPF